MRKFKISVNGNSYEVEVEELKGEEVKSKPVSKPSSTAAPKTKKAAPKPKAAPKKAKEEVAASTGQEVVEAPMPGNIWKLMVAEGDDVKEGDVLLILEAMKMENEIVAPKSGKVVALNATEGSAVSAGDNLLVLE